MGAKDVIEKILELKKLGYNSEINFISADDAAYYDWCFLFKITHGNIQDFRNEIPNYKNIPIDGLRVGSYISVHPKERKLRDE